MWFGGFKYWFFLLEQKEVELTFNLFFAFRSLLLYLSNVNPFLSGIQHMSSLTAVAQEALLTQIQQKQLPKGHELLRIGQVSHHMYFIHRGLACIYYYFNEIDVTTYFAMDN